MNLYEMDVDSIIKELKMGKLPDDVVKGLDLVFDRLERRPSAMDTLIIVAKGLGMMLPEKNTKEFTDIFARNYAREVYAHIAGADVEVDADALVKRVADGAWVQSWVWVNADNMVRHLVKLVRLDGVAKARCRNP